MSFVTSEISFEERVRMGGNIVLTGSVRITETLRPPSNTRIIGDVTGPLVPELVLASGVAHLIELRDVENVLIEGFRLRAEPGAIGHLIRCQDASRITLRDLELRDAPFYGIGCQAGAAIDHHYDNIFISGSGSCAIDFKDRDHRNARVRMNGISIVGFGLDPTQQAAGIDVRGAGFTLSNIFVHDVSEARTGIRFRFGSECGRRSTLVGFEVISPSGLGWHGVEIQCDDVHVSNGIVQGFGHPNPSAAGVLVQGVVDSADRCSVSSISAIDCARGFALGPLSTESSIRACRSLRCPTHAVDDSASGVIVR